MKSYTVICFFLSLSMILFPLVSVEKVSTVFANEFSIIEETLTNEKTEETETENSTVKVMNASSKNITEISLREYLIGVVAAEINPAYHEEAIKAQGLKGRLSSVPAEKIAKKSLKLVQKNKFRYIPGGFNKLTYFVSKLTPKSLAVKFAGKMWKKSQEKRNIK